MRHRRCSTSGVSYAVRALYSHNPMAPAAYKHSSSRLPPPQPPPFVYRDTAAPVVFLMQYMPFIPTIPWHPQLTNTHLAVWHRHSRTSGVSYAVRARYPHNPMAPAAYKHSSSRLAPTQPHQRCFLRSTCPLSPQSHGTRSLRNTNLTIRHGHSRCSRRLRLCFARNLIYVAAQ